MSMLDTPLPAMQPATADAVNEDALEELRHGGISTWESMEIAIGSLLVNKLRSLLTALGVIIGVAAVVALLAIGQGSQDAITASITANGANLLTVRSGTTSQGGVRGQVGAAQSLTVDDAKALADPQQVPDATLVAPEFDAFAQLVAGNQNLGARISGVTTPFAALHNLTLAQGDWINDDQNSSTASVIVLGANVAQTLFPSGDALGQNIRVRGLAFQVVGVLNAQGGSGFGSTDDSAYVPLSTAQRKLFGGRAISGGGAMLLSAIAVQAKDQNSVDAALSETTTTLRERHKLPADGSEDDFSVINQQDILNTAAQTSQVLTIFLGAIAAISLLVGGIGIMNIMLVSVRERTREIGLRKALGAREGDILFQFLIEALSISLAGGLIGLALGVLIAEGVSLSGVMRAAVSGSSVALAIGFALAVGLFFGIAPARSAARLDPIDALRYD